MHGLSFFNIIKISNKYGWDFLVSMVFKWTFTLKVWSIYIYLIVLYSHGNSQTLGMDEFTLKGATSPIPPTWACNNVYHIWHSVELIIYPTDNMKYGNHLLCSVQLISIISFAYLLSQMTFIGPN